MLFLEILDLNIGSLEPLEIIYAAYFSCYLDCNGGFLLPCCSLSISLKVIAHVPAGLDEFLGGKVISEISRDIGNKRLLKAGIWNSGHVTPATYYLPIPSQMESSGEIDSI